MRRRASGRPKKTVVIVGGNFAGLAALRELQKWQKSRCDEENLHIILIDRRSYSEYTPGILRLFCEPGYFFHLAQSLPETSDLNGCSLERIQGTVTSIVMENPTLRDGGMKKVLTYVSTIEYDRRDNVIEENARTSATTKNLSYDYLILATGATYTEPISSATPKLAGGPTIATTTMFGRYEEWKKAHERLNGANRVLILGGGAVGVELAAEILDRDKISTTNHQNTPRTTVTIVDAQPTLVPLFPRSVGTYAEDWLSQRGADLRLGESLRSWNDRSCTLEDGTVLHADVVYVCFGNRPNSEMVAVPLWEAEGTNTGSAFESDKSCLFSMTRRRNVVVKDTLQLIFNNSKDDDDVGFSDTPWFACGDVASPPSNDEKQAFQAEMQGKLSARNVIKMLESSSLEKQNENIPSLLRYPIDIARADRIPLVFVLSLGRYDGVLGFNSLCLSGPLAAIVKWILEDTKVSQMRGHLLGNLIWKIGDAVTLFLSRTLLRSPSTSTSRIKGARTHSRPVVSPHNSAAVSRTTTVSSSLPSQTIAPHHRQQQLEEQLKLS
jgi:NADH dehydrogenase FAD-containing subunit